MKTILYENLNELPCVGNGRLGAQLLASINNDHLFLNEESVWSAPYVKRNNPVARENINKIRNLLKDGKDFEANNMAQNSLVGIPRDSSYYVSAGQLNIQYFTKNGEFKNPDCYKRELDLETGIITSTFTANSEGPSTADFSNSESGSSISYTRELMASSPANIIALHVAASTPKSVYFKANFDRPEGMSMNYAVSDDTICFTATNAIPFCGMATVTTSGGKVYTQGATVIVEGADEATIYVDVQSAFRYYTYRKNLTASRSVEMWTIDYALKNICMAAAQNYPEMKSAHIQDFYHFWQKINAELNGDDDFDFNINRYKFISSNKKPATLPKPECGLWCDNSENGTNKRICVSPESTYSIWLNDIKTIPNYKKFYKSLYKHGIKTARVMYKVEGVAIHNYVDVWGDTAPIGWLEDGIAPLGAVEICKSIREYYEANLDIKFLKKNYKFLLNTCRFFAEVLVKKDDKYILTPSVKDGKIVESNSDDLEVIREAIRILFASAVDLNKNVNTNFFNLLREIYNSLGQEYSLSLDVEPTCAIITAMTASKICASCYENGVIKINLFPEMPSGSGKIEGLPLYGNLRFSAEWNDGSIQAAKVTAVANTNFCTEIELTYNGKTYQTKMTGDSLSLMNLLPSTI